MTPLVLLGEARGENEAKIMIWKQMNFHERVAKINELNLLGLRRVDIAEILSVSVSMLSIFCRKHNLKGLPQGAQIGNKSAEIHGQGRNTIMRLAKKVVASAGRQLNLCERCGHKPIEGELPIHHKDRNRLNNDPNNLEVLCQSCHNQEHASDRIRGKDGRYQPEA